MSKYADNEKVLPVLAPGNIVATETNTEFIDCDLVSGPIEFSIMFGTVTSTDTPFGATVTLTSCTQATTAGTETALAFKYRLSSAVATDSMGDLTAIGSTGYLVGDSDDNCALLCFIDAAEVAASYAGARWVRATITPVALTAACNVSAMARFTPRYAGASQPSST